MKTAVLIPCYNEAKIIARLFKEYRPMTFFGILALLFEVNLNILKALRPGESR